MLYVKHEEECFIRYPNTEKWVEKPGRSRVFFNQLRSLWISNETLFGVFDIASPSIDNSWRKPKQKFTEFELIIASRTNDVTKIETPCVTQTNKLFNVPFLVRR